MRQTSEQIDAGILDVAAGIFATYGYAHASVQQVADAVGYSKAGLLHRFGTKEALYRDVVVSGTETVNRIIAAVAEAGEGSRTTRDVLALMTDEALDRPGMVQLMLRAFDPMADDPYAEEIQALGYRLLNVLDRPISEPAERLRVVLGLQLLVNAALAQSSPIDMDLHVERAELVPIVVDLAAYVIGLEDA